MANDFEWLSLDELHERIKQQQDLEKSEVPVNPYQKNVNGHTVNVKGYQQQRQNAATPIIGIPGPKHHFASDPEKPKIGGGAPIENVQPTVPAKLPNVELTVSEDKPKPGTTDSFKYAPPQNPFTGKGASEISLDDIASALHKYPFIKNEQLKQLSKTDPDAYEKHFKNDPFKNLNKDARYALLEHIKNSVRKKFRDTAKWMQAERLEGWDEDKFINDFANQVVREMRPHRRLDKNHNYLHELDPKFKEVVDKISASKKPMLWSHQGVDPNEINTGDDLRHAIRKKAYSWARRFLETEANGGKWRSTLQNPFVVKQNKLKAKIYKNEHELNKLKKEAGAQAEGAPSIDNSLDYSFDELDNLASKAGYRLEQQKDKDGNPERIEIFEDNPEDIYNNLADTTKMATPKEVVDLKSGGKLGDVRDKLSALINPKQTSANHPLKKFIELEDAQKGHLEQINNLKSERAKLQLRLDRESVSPEQHYQSLSKNTADILSLVESYPVKGDKNVAQIGSLVYSALDLFAKENPAAISDGLNKIGAAKKFASQLSGEPATQLKIMLEKLQADAEAFKSKKTMSPAKREMMLNSLEGDLVDMDEQIKQHQTSLQQGKDEMTALQNNDLVSKYNTYKQQLADFKNEYENVTPDAETAWAQSLNKTNEEGEDTSSYGDDVGMNKWKEQGGGPMGWVTSGSEHKEEGPDWDEVIPKDINWDDPKEVAAAGHKMAESTKTTGDFLFGDHANGKYGLLDVAAHLSNHLVTSGALQDAVGKLLEQYPDPKKGNNIDKNAKVPHIFKDKSDAALTGPQRRWRKVHDYWKHNPDTVTNYAFMFSDYYPHPISTPDIEEAHANKDPEHQGFLDMVRKHTQGGDLPSTKTLNSQIHRMLRRLGNYAVEEATKDNPQTRSIFDKIKELNQHYKNKDSGEEPGNFRRNLERKIDVLYGFIHGKAPSPEVHPDWNHKVKDEGKWLEHVVKNTKKSLVIYIDNLLEKGASLLYVKK